MHKVKMWIIIIKLNKDWHYIGPFISYKKNPHKSSQDVKKVWPLKAWVEKAVKSKMAAKK